MGKCECGILKSVCGDGCRYCQPQTYIDNMETWLEEEREARRKLEKAYRYQLAAFRLIEFTWFNMQNGVNNHPKFTICRAHAYAIKNKAAELYKQAEEL